MEQSMENETQVRKPNIAYFLEKRKSKMATIAGHRDSKWAGTRYFYPPEIVYSTGGFEHNL
jgi:hypothetical protein